MYRFFSNLSTVGICVVSRRIHHSGLGIRRIQTRPQQLKQVEKSKGLFTGRKEERTGSGGKNKSTLYLKCLADMLSDSEVRGDDCIDRLYLLVISGKKKSESRQGQKTLLMQKHAINHHMQFLLNEK